jgi:hypothetical protein
MRQISRNETIALLLRLVRIKVLQERVESCRTRNASLAGQFRFDQLHFQKMCAQSVSERDERRC